ncbi:hypothetical protein TNCV_229291 [Trichonephila clavipes]|nr:hypothetical protein TNCV_229291 [Trichonephila clavipes]
MTHVLPLVGHVKFALKFENFIGDVALEGEGERKTERREGQRHGEEKHKQQSRMNEDDKRRRGKMAKERMDGDFARIDESSAN